MLDGRKISPPSSQRARAEIRNRILAFQELDRAGMAEALLDAKRALIEAGVLSSDSEDKDAHWGLSKTITSLAVRLDPDVALKDGEEPYEGHSDERLADHVLFAISHCYMDLFSDPDPDISALHDFLITDDMTGKPINALTVAIDTISPGRHPQREVVDDRAPLEGLYVIGRDGHQDSVLLYRDDHEEAQQAFRAACAMQEGEEVADSDKEMRRILGKMWLNRRFSEIELQNVDGEILDEWRFPKPEQEVIHNEEDELSPEM